MIFEKSKIPAKEWRWNETDIGYEGVSTAEGILKWFTFRKMHNANILASEQRLEDYIHYGPLKENVPTDVMLELYDIIMGAMNTDTLY